MGEVFRNFLKAKRELLKESLADGDFMEQEHFGTAVRTAAVIAQCKVLQGLLDLDYDTLIQELDDANEHSRMESSWQGNPSQTN